MAQTLIDISKIKDFDSGRAIDALAAVVAVFSPGGTGALSVTSINKVAITAPATSATLTIANAKTLTVSNTLTFTGTDSSSVAFGAGGTVGATGYAATGQVPGTATNDSATAGNVGQLVGGTVFGTASTATITVTIAVPGVVTWTSHGFSTTIPQPVVFTNSGGALPTGITSGTVYYTVPSSVTTNTFQIATTVANAYVPTSITTSGSQSGTQTGTGGTAMANTTTIDVTGLSLTAGDWDVWGEISWDANASTTWTKLETSINQTTATLATSGSVIGSVYSSLAQLSAAATNGVSNVVLPQCTVSIATTTNVFLSVKGTFGTNTLGARGFIIARRIR